MKRGQKLSTGTVYSTDIGKTCPECTQPIKECRCSGTTVPSPGDGTVRVRKETKGRQGKCVTVVLGVPLATPELKDLAKKLKAKCGSGGSVKDGNIEIQGDHCDLVIQELSKLGWKVKRAGG